MTPNPQLALAIPTCNHPDLIQTSITAMLPELTQFNIPVYVSDNSTTLDTEQVVAALQIEYPYIYYRRNKQNLGYDANCHLAITWPDTDFVWPIGDGMIIRPGGIAAVLRWVSPDRDFIFVNCRVPNLKNEVVNPSDIRSFLIEVTWHITLLGATVYGRRPRSIDITPEQRVSWKNFIHLGLILF
jgi:glycosyltransferase involved in cell wall biosynthesis